MMSLQCFNSEDAVKLGLYDMWLCPTVMGFCQLHAEHRSLVENHLEHPPEGRRASEGGSRSHLQDELKMLVEITS